MSMEVNYKRALNELHGNSKLADLQIKNWRGAMELAPAVIEVLKTFDGKKITKRLETALQKINPHIRVVANSCGLGWACYLYFDEFMGVDGYYTAYKVNVTFVNDSAVVTCAWTCGY